MGRYEGWGGGGLGLSVWKYMWELGMYGRISSTLPTIPGQALLASYPSLLLKSKLYPIPNQSIHPLLIYPTFNKTFPYPTHNHLLTCPFRPYEILSINTGVWLVINSIFYVFHIEFRR